MGEKKVREADFLMGVIVNLGLRNGEGNPCVKT